MTARSSSGVEAACCVVEDRVSGKRPENRGQRGLREARGASSKEVGSGRNGGGGEIYFSIEKALKRRR